MILVTKPFLPPRGEYEKFIDGIWTRNWLTNNGPLVNDLELKLKEFLGLNHLLYVSNGTVALQLALQVLEVKGEVITTPFSFVATASSIVWEKCQPVFADIDEHTFNIDPASVRQRITPKTTAILATHVYGNPCDVEALESIAREHNLKVIYDAAHAFGVSYKGKSLYAYGDISTASFHATKVFHTIEGGALITRDATVLKKLSWMRNFGYGDDGQIYSLGINGKNSEFHAAMGLSVLPYIPEVIRRRKTLTEFYRMRLANLNASYQRIGADVTYNYAYFPIVLENEEFVMRSFKLLEDNRIYPRRYFYPSLHKLPYVTTQEVPVSANIAGRVLCLPLYDSLREEEIELIVRLLLRVQNNKP